MWDFDYHLADDTTPQSSVYKLDLSSLKTEAQHQEAFDKITVEMFQSLCLLGVYIFVPTILSFFMPPVALVLLIALSGYALISLFHSVSSASDLVGVIDHLDEIKEPKEQSRFDTLMSLLFGNRDTDKQKENMEEDSLDGMCPDDFEGYKYSDGPSN